MTPNMTAAFRQSGQDLFPVSNWFMHCNMILQTVSKKLLAWGMQRASRTQVSYTILTYWLLAFAYCCFCFSYRFC